MHDLIPIPRELSLKEIHIHFDRIYIDNNILSGCRKNNKTKSGFVCGFAEHLYKARRYHDLCDRILIQQEISLRSLAEIIADKPFCTTKEIIQEYDAFTQYITHCLRHFRKTSIRRSGSKQFTLEQILAYSRAIRDGLIIVPYDQYFVDFFQKHRLHYPRVRELRRKTANIDKDCSTADASLVSAALTDNQRAAIITNDLDVPNIVYNLGKEFARFNRVHHISVYYQVSSAHGSYLSFSCNSRTTYKTPKKIY